MEQQTALPSIVKSEPAADRTSEWTVESAERRYFGMQFGLNREITQSTKVKAAFQETQAILPFVTFVICSKSSLTSPNRYFIRFH
jgi:hypothetical protein